MGFGVCFKRARYYFFALMLMSQTLYVFDNFIVDMCDGKQIQEIVLSFPTLHM